MTSYTRLPHAAVSHSSAIESNFAPPAEAISFALTTLRLAVKYHTVHTPTHSLTSCPHGHQDRQINASPLDDLAELLASDDEHGRRMSVPESAPGHLAAKLEQKTIDFEELDKAVNKYRSRNSSWYVNT